MYITAAAQHPLAVNPQRDELFVELFILSTDLNFVVRIFTFLVAQLGFNMRLCQMKNDKNKNLLKLHVKHNTIYSTLFLNIIAVFLEDNSFLRLVILMVGSYNILLADFQVFNQN